MPWSRHRAIYKSKVFGVPAEVFALYKAVGYGNVFTVEKRVRDKSLTSGS